MAEDPKYGAPSVNLTQELDMKYFCVIPSTLIRVAGSYTFAEMQSAYSTASANWAVIIFKMFILDYMHCSPSADRSH